MALHDDYLPCENYLGKELDSENDKITIFFDAETERYYFALLSLNGEILLKSEGYTTLKARENGLKAVLKNILEPKRLSISAEGNSYRIILKAGNHQEIAVSCDFQSEADAKKSLDLINTFGNSAKTEKSTAKKVTKTASTKKETEKEPKTTKSVQKEQTTAPFNQVDFLPSDVYLNQERIWDSYGITGFVKFRNHDNGQFYFGVYNPDGSLYLRSKGFDNEDARDDAFDLMESSILLEENYKVEQVNGHYYAILFEYSEVLAISKAFDTFIDAFVTTPGGRPKENVVGTMY